MYHSYSLKTVRQQLVSQILLDYSDLTGNSKTMSSYEAAALNGQINVKVIKGGIRVNYTLGDTTARFLLPGRMVASKFEELLLGTLGIGSTKKLFDPYWFTTQNFHGQWYYDGDELEKYCHFRANIPVKQYFKQMMNNVEFFYKLAFLAKPFAFAVKPFMKKIAQTPEYGTLWWAANNVDVRMTSYYGSKENFEITVEDTVALH